MAEECSCGHPRLLSLASWVHWCPDCRLWLGSWFGEPARQMAQVAKDGAVPLSPSVSLDAARKPEGA
jgi:hypothetical protein